MPGYFDITWELLKEILCLPEKTSIYDLIPNANNTLRICINHPELDKYEFCRCNPKVKRAEIINWNIIEEESNEQ